MRKEVNEKTENDLNKLNEDLGKARQKMDQYSSNSKSLI